MVGGREFECKLPGVMADNLRGHVALHAHDVVTQVWDVNPALTCFFINLKGLFSVGQSATGAFALPEAPRVKKKASAATTHTTATAAATTPVES